MAEELPTEALGAEEHYLAKIAGEDVPLPNEPRGRKEHYLAYIAENGGGGGGGGGGTTNFNNLTNRPKYNGTVMSGSTDIPAVTENTVSGWGFTKNTGTYSKPINGIPKTDLESAVQTSLGKADTAIQDISGKQDKLTAGSNITIASDGKTISATNTTYEAATESAAGLMSAADKTKLDGISSGAGVNVKSNWTENDSNSDAYILNKPTIPVVNNSTITVQMNGSTVDTFTTNAASAKTINLGTVVTDISGKQNTIDSSHKLSADLVDDTSATNKFVTAAEKTKLSSIATGAEVNVQANWNETNTSSDAYIQNKPNLSAKEDTSNKVTSLSSSSTDTQYPSAKAVYNNEYSIVSNNKFDNSYDEIGKLDVTTGEDLSATTYNRTNFRDLGKTITGNLYVTISETTSNFMYICYYDENKVFLKGRTIWEASAADTYEDYVEGARYFRISVKNTWQGSIYISYVYNGVDTANYEYIKKIFTIDDVQKPLIGKTIINFGDSIFGKRRPPNDISTYISKLTGGTVYNCGFGGLTAGTHYSQYYDPFALHSLADSIYSGDWSVQDAAVTAGAGVIPDYFADTVDLLESLDFTKVDMITIAYGTNDWNFGMAMDNSNNNKDLTTYAGALRYSIEKILAVYPHIKIFLCTPIFRVMLDSSYVVTGDSDTATNINGKKLTDFIEKLKAVALEYHLTYIDNYYGLGINIKNWLYYFKNTDGTHPIITGCHLIAEHMSQVLMGDYTTPSIKVKSENSTTAGEVYDVTYINTMIGDVESILTTLTTGSGV